MVNEVLDLDLYVEPQRVKLFGRTHEMHRLSNKEYFEMNQLDVRFQSALDRVRSESVQEIADKLNGTIDDIKAKTDDKEEQNELIFKERLLLNNKLEDVIRSKMNDALDEREQDIQNFVKTLIPSLTDEEIGKSTINLFNALRREIEIRIYMDKYYTREEALQKLKDSEEADFREAMKMREQALTVPQAGSADKFDSADTDGNIQQNK